MNLPISPMLAFLRQRIMQTHNWLPFSEYMDSVLYTPELGYYANYQRKIGFFSKDGSDFITAPELTPLFAQSLADTLAQTMQDHDLQHVLELGAGSGQLAIDLLLAWDQQGIEIQQYAIVELSAVLRLRQQQNVQKALSAYPHLLKKIVWLDALPYKISGLILGNEVLDAIPVQLYIRKNSVWYERGISWQDASPYLIWQDQQCTDVPEVLAQLPGTQDYLTETHVRAQAFIRTLADKLERGLMLFIDYGFPGAEYYHPQRLQGTLMTHYRHQASIDPLFHPGEADLTAHINFSAIADAMCQSGLDLIGYTSQARFLLNAGLLTRLSQFDARDAARFLPQAKAVQQLTSEAEMGELFKVIACTRGIDAHLSGFARGDRSHTL
jgi:SAM-dependent MidA family methyltransferase